MKLQKLFALVVLCAGLVSCSPAAPTSLSGSPTPVPATATSAPLPPSPTAIPPSPTAETVEQGIRPGDEVQGMRIVAGVGEEAASTNIWDYCDPIVNATVDAKVRECSVPAFEALFIGNGVGVIASANTAAELDANWSALHWKLYLDDQPIDLPAFGPIDVWGGTFRLWNVVIEQPTLGKHTLRYVVATSLDFLNPEEATWAFTIKGLAEFPELSVQLPPQPTPMPAPSQPPSLGSGGLPWWNDRIFYEVFVRSFKDSDGDGIGDLQGLISQLDYLNDGDPETGDDLGVTGLWLMPVAQSPSYHGYDVTDYKTIEADYGSNEDFKQLMAEAHQRGMVIIVDLVMNHTSSEHPWFLESQKPGSEYRSWYIWDDSPIPFPSPWGSQVWHPLGDSYYYGLFWEGMPDLNYRNGDVTQAMRDVIQFWLRDMGVDGFRLDAVRHLIEDGAIQQNTPETHAWLQDFYRYVHTLSPQVLTVGEVWDTSAAVAPYIGDEMDICFEFDLATAILEAAKRGENNQLVDVQQRVLETYPRGQYASFLTNHDQNRVINQLLKHVDQAKIAATLLLTNPGVPFIYYGEEIGMRGVKPDERIRTPMQWDSSANAGFTSGTPWEALNNDVSTVNVAVQAEDPHSLLNHYRGLLHLRAEHTALRTGEMALVKSSTTQVYAFLRHDESETLLVLVNLASEPISSYELSLAESPLQGSPGATLLFGEGQATAPLLNVSGGFQAYMPLPELAPHGSYILRLATDGE